MFQTRILFRVKGSSGVIMGDNRCTPGLSQANWKLEHMVTLAKRVLWRSPLYRLGVQEKFLEEQRAE